MNKLILTAFVMLIALPLSAQNSVTIGQTGGAGNSASVTQSGEGNSVSISQMGDISTEDSKPGNRVSLRVPEGTETTINQHNIGPNAVEISQAGQATATINQRSDTAEHSVLTLPEPRPIAPKNRPAKRRQPKP